MISKRGYFFISDIYSRGMDYFYQFNCFYWNYSS